MGGKCLTVAWGHITQARLQDESPPSRGHKPSVTRWQSVTATPESTYVTSRAQQVLLSTGLCVREKGEGGNGPVGWEERDGNGPDLLHRVPAKLFPSIKAGPDENKRSTRSGSVFTKAVASATEALDTLMVPCFSAGEGRAAATRVAGAGYPKHGS